MAACFTISVDIIEPAGFDVSDRALKRAALDYLPHVQLHRHASWTAFRSWQTENRRRLVLLTTRATTPYTEHHFHSDDILLMGRESAGVPPHVHDAADAKLVIPLKPELRSLNVAVASGIVVAEALRQTGTFPKNH